MPKLFVLHCPKACGHRRLGLEEHLKKRGFTDVEWITDYSVDHPYVQWLHGRLKDTSLPHVSGLVKAYEMFMKVLRDAKSDDEFFWKCDDDVRFIKNWDVLLPKNFMYINLSVGVNFHILPDGKPQLIGNNGGAEVFCFNRVFAKLMLDNLDTRQTGDILIHALLNKIGHPLVCIPIAHQTSILEPKTSANPPNPSQIHWIDFIRNFKPTGLSYIELRNASGFFAREDA
jgi:hypothetical protein